MNDSMFLISAVTQPYIKIFIFWKGQLTLVPTLIINKDINEGEGQGNTIYGIYFARIKNKRYLNNKYLLQISAKPSNCSLVNREKEGRCTCT